MTTRIPSKSVTPSVQTKPAAPKQAPVAAKPPARATFGNEFSSGRGSALRAKALNVTGARLPPPIKSGSASPSSLLTESIGDGSANCLERAYAAAGPKDSVTLLRDTRDPVGHAVVERADGSVFDPTTRKAYGSMNEYLAANPRYELRPEAQARNIPKAALAAVFATPAGSRARQEALAAAGLSTLARVKLADGPISTKDAIDQIKRLLEESFPSNIDVTHDDLLAISDVLERVPPDQLSAVMAGLSDADLQKWIGEMNSGGILGTGGLDGSERAELFGLLAQNLDPTQAARFLTALESGEQIAQFGDAYLAQATPDEKVAFLQVIGQTDFPDGERGGTGHVIATALASLTSDPTHLAEAVNVLSQQNLQDGLIAAGEARWNPMGPFGGQQQFQNLGAMQRIVDAIANSGDPRARAASFEALGFVLREVVRGNAPMQDMEAVADSISSMMTTLLGRDPAAVLAQLSGDGGIDPTGKAITAWASEQLRNGGGALGQIAELLRATDLTSPGANNRYDNAFLAGYFAGGVFKAVDSLQVTDLFPDAALLQLASLVVAFRTDPATGILLDGVLSAAERETIERAMREGGASVRRAILGLLGVQLSPGNDNGTAVGGFEQGLFAVYGGELYEK